APDRNVWKCRLPRSVSQRPGEHHIAIERTQLHVDAGNAHCSLERRDRGNNTSRIGGSLRTGTGCLESDTVTATSHSTSPSAYECHDERCNGRPPGRRWCSTAKLRHRHRHLTTRALHGERTNVLKPAMQTRIPSAPLFDATRISDDRPPAYPALVSPLCGSKRELCTRFLNEPHNGLGAPQARVGGPRGRSRPDLVGCGAFVNVL